MNLRVEFQKHWSSTKHTTRQGCWRTNGHCQLTSYRIHKALNAVKSVMNLFLCSIIIGCKIFQLCILAPTKDTGIILLHGMGFQNHNHSLDLGCPSCIPIRGEVPCSALCQSSVCWGISVPSTYALLQLEALHRGECHWWSWWEIWKPFLPWLSYSLERMLEEVQHSSGSFPWMLIIGELLVHGWREDAEGLQPDVCVLSCWQHAS